MIIRRFPPAGENMAQALLEKINHIESLLLEINAKIDNFLGFEEMGEEEKKEIKALRKEIDSEGYVSFEHVFED